MGAKPRKELNLQQKASFLQQGIFVEGPDRRIFLGLGAWESSANSDPGRPHFFFSDFFLKSPKPYYYPKAFLELSRDEFFDNFDQGSLKMPPAHEPLFEDFQREFLAFKAAEQRSELQKLVPVVFSAWSQTTGAEVKESLLAELGKVQGSSRVFGFWTSEEGMLGASPEVFFDLEASRLKTMALAGTRALDGESLLNSPKDLSEHQLVIEGIVENLKNFSSGLSLSPTEEHRLPNLVHLKTEISAELKLETRIEDLIHALHPTPALGGFPQMQAFEFLKNLPGSEKRGPFGSPFGVLLPKGRAHLIVAIRCLQWGKSQMQLGTGCGLVAASELDKEWLELKLKRSAVRRMFGL